MRAAIGTCRLQLRLRNALARDARRHTNLPCVLLAEARLQVEHDGGEPDDEAGGQDALDDVGHSSLHDAARAMAEGTQQSGNKQHMLGRQVRASTSSRWGGNIGAQPAQVGAATLGLNQLTLGRQHWGSTSSRWGGNKQHTLGRQVQASTSSHALSDTHNAASARQFSFRPLLHKNIPLPVYE
eukprot:1159915-Pelagomonas_calceolata.AAC.6